LNWRVCSSDGGVVHPVGAPEPGRSMWIEERLWEVTPHTSFRKNWV
jgi:hypothetical protein